LRNIEGPSCCHCQTHHEILERIVLSTKTYNAQPSSNNQLIIYYDANYVANMDDRKSRFAYVLVFNGGPITWGSHKQTCTTTSTMEVEYIVAHLASPEIIWLHRLLHNLKYAQIGPTMFYNDN
jgi:hypothetical protein